MSVSNLFFPNDYQLNCENLTATNQVQASDLKTTSLEVNTIQNNESTNLGLYTGGGGASDAVFVKFATGAPQTTSVFVGENSAASAGVVLKAGYTAGVPDPTITEVFTKGTMNADGNIFSNAGSVIATPLTDANLANISHPINATHAFKGSLVIADSFKVWVKSVGTAGGDWVEVGNVSSTITPS